MSRTQPTPHQPMPHRPGPRGPVPPASVLRGRLRGLARDDDGMSTVEYAVGTVAAAAFAALLYAIVSGDDIVAALTGIVQRALSTTF